MYFKMVFEHSFGVGMEKKISGFMKNKNEYIEIIVILACVMGMNLFLAFKERPLLYPSDSAQSISVAALLAGYDWKDAISTGKYYGIGYLFVYFPLFLLKCSPTVIYRTVAVVASFLIGITAIIARRIVYRHWPDISFPKRIMVSVISGSVSICNTFVFSMRNEEMLLVCSWLIAMLLIDVYLSDYTCQKKQLTIVFLMIYVNFLHARAIIIVFSVVLFCAISFLVESKCILRLWHWCIYAIGYFLSGLAIKLYQISIWGSKIPGNSSAVASASSGLAQFIADLDSVKGIIMINIGILFTQLSLTVGILFVSIAMIVLVAIKLKWKRDKRICALLFLGVSYIAGWIMLVAGQSITWLSGVRNGIASGNMKWVYHYKAFTYTRYSGFFVPIIVFSGLILFELLYDLQIKAIKIAVISGIAVTYVWYKVVLPYRELSWGDYYFFPFTGLMGQRIDVSAGVANIVYVLSFLCLLMLLGCFLKNRFWMIITIFIVLVTNFQRYVIFDGNVTKYEDKHLALANAGTELLNNIRDDLAELHYDNNDIYVLSLNTTNSGGVLCRYYQYMNYDKRILHGMPNEIEDDALLFSNGYPHSIYFKDYMYSRLDKNEYVFCKGDIYKNVLEENGVELLPYEIK